MNIKISVDDNYKEPETYRLESLERAICDIFAVSRDDLRGKNRMAYIITPRHVLYYMGYTHTSNSMPSLGMRLGRDHTTILYGVQKIRERKLRNKKLAQKLEEVHMLALAYEEQIQNGMDEIREEVQDMIERIQMEKLNGLRAS